MKKYINGIIISSLIMLVMIASFILGSACKTQDARRPYNLSNITDRQEEAVLPIDQESYDNPFVDLAQKLNPVVVNINTSKTVQRRSPFQNDPFFDDFFSRFFGNEYGYQREFQAQSLGSGFIISEDGYILTNNHVIKDADEIDVILYDGTKYSAEIIGRDPDTDVGLIRIDADGLPFADLGNSDETRVGEWVMAIGNPFGLSNTVTKGIVSAKERSLGNSQYDNYLQTDASINPGNSGGPLINLKGEVIGINSAIIANAYGLGFAVPINTAKSLLPQLMQGDVRKGWIGISIQDLDDDLIKALDLESREGVLVSDVTEDSPAEKAGIQPADVIIEIDGEKMKNSTQLATAIALKGPDAEIKVKLLRDGKEYSMNVKLGDREDYISSGSSSPGQKDRKEFKDLGLTLMPINDQLRNRFSIPEQITSGLVIINIDNSRSYRLSRVLSVGDVIIEVNQSGIRTLKDFETQLDRIKEGKIILLRIVRQNQLLYVTITK